MNKKLVKPYDLDVIFSLATDRYVSTQQEQLTEQQFRAKCFMEAVLNYLNIDDVKFEEKKLVESLDE